MVSREVACVSPPNPSGLFRPRTARVVVTSPTTKSQISGLLEPMTAQPPRPHFLASTPEIVLSAFFLSRPEAWQSCAGATDQRPQTDRWCSQNTHPPTPTQGVGKRRQTLAIAVFAAFAPGFLLLPMPGQQQEQQEADSIHAACPLYLIREGNERGHRFERGTEGPPILPPTGSNEAVAGHDDPGH